MLVYTGVNNLIFTLTEKAALTNPEFVLIIVNESTKKKVACKLGTDISSYPTRNNEFVVTVNSSPDPLLAQVKLVNEGSHRYLVYEMADADTFDFSGVNTLDLQTLTGEVERGRMNHKVTHGETKKYKTTAESVKTYHGTIS